MFTLCFGNESNRGIKKNASRILYHWLSQRFTAFILLPSIFVYLGAFIYTTHIVDFSVYNLTSIFLMFLATGGTLANIFGGVSTTELFIQGCFLYKVYFFLMFLFIFIHLLEGAQSIIDDYVHQECTKIFVVDILFKVLQLLLVKNLFLWVFLSNLI